VQIFSDTYTKWTRIFFAVMTVFAVVFANERFQADGAHYLLHVVQSENFRVEHQRFILIFSQFLPWAGVQIGAPLSTIIALNSLNPVVWWLLCFLYATYFLKDRHAGIGIILTHVLGILHIQFTPMYEIWYGVPLVILLYAHLRNDRIRKPAELIFFFVILITILFAHPLLPIPVAFVFLYFIIEQRKINWKLMIPVVIVAAAWYATKKMMLTEYEAGKMSLMGAEWNDSPKHLLEIGYYGKLAVFFLTWYLVPVLLFIWLALFFILRKMRWQLIATSAFFFGHILLINYTHTTDAELSPYFERMYLPLIPIVLVPFLFTLCRELEMRPGLIVAGLFLIIGWRVARFIDVGMDYKQKTKFAEQLISHAQKQPGSKFQMAMEDERSCYDWSDWSFTMETVLRSSAVEPYKTVSIVRNDDLDENDNRNKLLEDEFLFRRWDVMKDKDINRAYFKMSNGKYQQLTSICSRKVPE
jgi:hypothetical protein